MRSRQLVSFLLSATLLSQFVPRAEACGPEPLQPIFVFQNSPDPPFREFTQGKIGIVKPTFGRKTLVIAYRYLSGGSFTADEQKGLVEALKGLSPEPDNDDAIKAWIAARSLIVKDEGELPEIYRESKYPGFDFFPNCTANAFEVATETLKDRTSRFGTEDTNVLEWLKGQDIVFRNCAVGYMLPAAVGSERPAWLRKDRDYQIAAALFYSLKFKEAREAFERIAQDPESDWQQTADYLVARTLVRQASLEENEAVKRSLHEVAETYLVNLLARTTRFRNATQKLLGLVKYRFRPEQRVAELAHTLLVYSGNENVRQDLIDYVWLLDKFEKKIQDEQAQKEKLLNPVPDEGGTTPNPAQVEWQKVREQVDRGELINLWMPSINGDGQENYSDARTFYFKPDASKTEILETVEGAFQRKLSAVEIKQLWDRHLEALQWRQFRLSPNRKFNWRDGYEGCDYECNGITLDLLPEFLKMSELNDWIFTIQSRDPKAYSHALTKWRETQSEAWFVAALTKAKKESTSLNRLLVAAESVSSDAAMFATVAYNRARLLSETGRQAEARNMLDEVLKTTFDTFPSSAQNEFLELRMKMAVSVSEFLRYAARKPIVFYQYGQMGTLEDFLALPQDSNEEAGEVDQQHVDKIKRLLDWDGRMLFDQFTVELMNWHFGVAALIEASKDPGLPDYLRHRVLFAAWVRAILLKQDEIAQQVAREIIHSLPNEAQRFQPYLEAATTSQREDASLFLLLKSPELSPYLFAGLPEENPLDQSGWWCQLEETDYNEKGEEVPKIVVTPAFLKSDRLEVAKKERAELIALGDAKSFLGRRVIEWAKRSPRDPRIPEALFIAVNANESYKFGCNGWENDEETRAQAEKLLLERYGESPWAAKLRESKQLN